MSITPDDASVASAVEATLSGDASLDLPEFEAPPADPLALAVEWLADAVRYPVREPAAAVLATASADGEPSSRVVLVKTVTDLGAVFSTADGSRKASDLRANPRAALTFYWRETLQQLSMRGVVHRLTEVESDALFAGRPRGARAASITSTPGAPLDDEDAVAAAVARMAASDAELARPSTWHGYLLVPNAIEFWHGRSNRLHRRLLYDRDGDGWRATRVQA